MKAKILIVDDSALARRMIRKIVEELGHEAEDASDGEQALERYQLHHHDAVILDLLMQGMYGMEVLRKLKEMNPNLPVIVASADLQKPTRKEVKETGAAGMINKPLAKEQLGVVLKGGTAWS